MQNKGTGPKKSATQIICDSIFKVVDHELKKLDAKWTKRFKDIGALGPTSPSPPVVISRGGVLVVPFSLAASEWTSTVNGDYRAEVTNHAITSSMVMVEYSPTAESAVNLTGMLEWETVMGKVILVSQTLPSGTIAGDLYLEEKTA